MFPIIYFPTKQLNPVEIFPTLESISIEDSEEQENAGTRVRTRIWKILESQPSNSSPCEEIIFRQKALQHLNQGVDDDEDYFLSSWRLDSVFHYILRDYLSNGNIKDSDQLDELLRQEYSNQRQSDSSVTFPGNGAIYEIHQSIHGDIHIGKCTIPKQGELFEKDWEYLSENETTGFRIYQETSQLTAILILGYIKSGCPKNKLRETLEKMQTLSKQGCFASDSGTKEDEIKFIAELLKMDITRIDTSPEGDIFLGKAYEGNQNSISFIFHKASGTIKAGNYIRSKTGELHFHERMEILPQDIPSFLCGIHMFPGRSGNAPFLILKEILRYINT